ncbi:16S rRNA (guanine(527)-N(7))-methyltransferase RsmG [Alkaliphilus serpentinus]|nr:16S rRNA (guanine(527)-N(7))-methyltransferase RsmG [Alkaliphilus serpentinus]
MKKGFSDLGIDLNENQMNQFMIYKNLLLEWNEKMNLTAIEDERDIVIKHFIDSISCLKVKGFDKINRLIDVGTGAGFPGIPIKIMEPNIELTLLDALNKRVTFLKEVCKETSLVKVDFLHGRAEDFGRLDDFRESYDAAVSRAVASLNVLVEYCMPFIKVGGIFICQKGPQVEDEMASSKKAIEVLGGKVVEKLEISLPLSDIKHKIVVIEKVKPTPTKYPRKAGKPTKSPII